MSELFTEAIADAKKIREVAEENAKKAILESVTPKIREFIESQLLEQDEEDKESEKNNVLKDEEDKKASIDETVELDETAITSLLGLIGEDIGDLSGASQSVMNGALQEAMTMLSESERVKLVNLANKFNKTSENLNSSSLYNHNKEKQMTRDKYYEIDLKALREAVEEEMGDLGEEMPDLPADDIMADDMPDEDEPGGAIPEDEVEDAIQKMIDELGLSLGEEDLDLEAEEDLDVMDELPEDEEGEEDPEQLDEIFNIDPRMLQQELRNIRRRVNEASEKGLAHESGGISKDYEHHFGGKGSKNAGKGGSFGGGKPGKDVLSEIRKTLRNQRRQNGALQNKLTKYRSAVDTLREQLEELNLFNAKLLYVNKLLQNKTISESQKRSIVKALDEAKDLREAKVLYKNLTESFSSRTSRSSRGRTLNESASLGGASRTTRSASSQNASTEVDRWARLAGIKK